MLEERKITIKNISILLIIIFISMKFIPTGDDYFFLNLKYDSIFQLFSDMKNGTLTMKDGTYLLTHNGRYLGNFFGITISKIATSQYLQYLRCLIMAVGIIGVIFLTSKISNFERKNSFFYSSLLFLVAPIGVYREVYSWTAGYMNYLLPIIPLLLCILILRQTLYSNNGTNVIKIFILIILGFITQLFIEHITIYMVILGVAFTILCYFKYRKNIKIAIEFLISTLIGAFIMFSNSGYRAVANSTDEYRSIAKGFKELILKIISNVYEMSRYIVIDNLILTIIIMALCIILISKNIRSDDKFYNIICKVSIISSLIIIIYVSLINLIDKLNYNVNFGSIEVYLSILVASIFLIILIFTTLISITDMKYKINILLYILSIVLLSVPLTIVSPIGTRCFFICYVFLVIITLDIIQYIKENKIFEFSTYNLTKILVVTMCLVVVSKIYIMTSIKYVYDERIKYINKKMIDNECEIVIPELPFNKYIQNDSNKFLSQYYYYNKIGDIKFTIKDYKEWKAEFE